MSAFKTLYTGMIEAGGNYDALPANLLKKDLQVFVKESRPYFLVSDSFFYVPAYFTQAAMNEYNSKFSSVNVQDLESKVIVITKWTLELRKVNSAEVFTSYAGLECRLIVHSFKPQLKADVNLHPSRYPTNLYRDDEFKTTIQAFRHKQVCAAAASKPASMPAIGSGKGNVGQGVLANSCGDWSFKEGSTKTVTLGGGKAKKPAGDAKVAVKGGAKKSAKKPTKGKASAVAALVSSGKASKGKKSTTGKAKASPGAGKRTKPRSTSEMTVKKYKAYLKSVQGGEKKKKKDLSYIVKRIS